jgi:hypothetical protein
MSGNVTLNRRLPVRLVRTGKAEADRQHPGLATAACIMSLCLVCMNSQKIALSDDFLGAPSLPEVPTSPTAPTPTAGLEPSINRACYRKKPKPCPEMITDDCSHNRPELYIESYTLSEIKDHYAVYCPVLKYKPCPRTEFAFPINIAPEDEPFESEDEGFAMFGKGGPTEKICHFLVKCQTVVIPIDGTASQDANPHGCKPCRRIALSIDDVPENSLDVDSIEGDDTSEVLIDGDHPRLVCADIAVCQTQFVTRDGLMPRNGRNTPLVEDGHARPVILKWIQIIEDLDCDEIYGPPRTITPVGGHAQ